MPILQELDFTLAKSRVWPSNSKIRPNEPRKPQTLCTKAVFIFKPRTRHILGYMAQNVIWRSPNPSATSHFL